MIYIIILLFIFISSAIVLQFKYANPYRLYMVFGKKGSGKTTLMCKLALKYHKRGYLVYSNIDLPYARKFLPSSLGLQVPPPKSVILLDEVGLIWDNRDYAKFPVHVKQYFKYQRQYRHIVYLFSQSTDVDKKIRDLTDNLYLCTSPFPWLSVVRKIRRFVTLTQPDNDSEGRIADGLEFIPFWHIIFDPTCFSLTYIPRYAPYFKSYNPPPAPPSAFSDSLSPVPEKMRKKIVKRLVKCYVLCYNLKCKIKKRLSRNVGGKRG